MAKFHSHQISRTGNLHRERIVSKSNGEKKQNTKQNKKPKQINKKQNYAEVIGVECCEFKKFLSYILLKLLILHRRF